jgi:hypothetical protein
MATYDYSVSANNNNATYSVVLKPYTTDSSNHKIDIKISLSNPTLSAPDYPGVDLSTFGAVKVNNATNGTNHINCTLQIKDTTNLYTPAGYSTGDNTTIADGVLTSQGDSDGAVAQGASIYDQVTEAKVNDLLARIVANWEGILTTDETGADSGNKNCPIKNIFLRITV